MSNSPQDQAAINAICDAFARELRAGHQPQLTEYLAKVAETQQRDLLRELLAQESELLSADNWQAHVDRYQQDMPHLADVVRQVDVARERTRPGRADRSEMDSLHTRAGLKQRQTDPPQRQIGPYKILQVIGEGGMGSVYMAEQEQPVKRRVALKVIKAGLDSKQVIARFEAERKALAMMDHPSIARILDAGTTDTGQPFFAMELVKGVALNEYCDRHRLSIPERLKIFRQTCEAIQHAHQKGIIHRDLKPSNILVAEYNGQPVPKVIDFGLAKALEVTNKLTDKTMFTEFGQVLGTLKYMSPEQAGLDSLDIDTRSDIYSLGVILYELLTGATPLDDGSIRGQAMLKILELVRDQEAPRPSSRLTTSKATLNTVTEQRRIDPRKLTQILSGDLDWIVMKAIDKDRTRRYESAGAFADDVERYLTDEAVAARPPSTAYKLKKFVRKNRGLVAAVGTTAALLLAGIIGTSYGLYRADVARQDAELARQDALAEKEEADEAREEVEALAAEKTRLAEAERGARVKAQEQQRLAELRMAQNNSLNQTMIDIFKGVDLSERTLNSQPLGLVLAQRLKGIASQLKDENVGNPLAVARMQAELADTLLYSGMHAEAEPLARDAARTAEQKLGKSSLQFITAANTLALTLRAGGRPDLAVEILQDLAPIARKEFGLDDSSTLNIAANLAMALHMSGQFREAIPAHADVVRRGRHLFGDGHPQYLTYLHNQATCLHEFGDHQAALDILVKVLSAYENHAGVSEYNRLVAQSSLVSVYSAVGEYKKAIGAALQHVERCEQRLGASSFAALEARNLLGSAHYRAGDYQQAMKIYREVLDEAEALRGAKHPFTVNVQQSLADTHAALGDAKETNRVHGQAIASFESVYGPVHRRTLGARHRLGVALTQLEQWSNAEEVFRSVDASLAEAQMVETPFFLENRAELAEAMQRQGKYDASIDLFQDVLESRKLLFGVDHPLVIYALQNLGYAECAAGRLDQAIPKLSEAYQAIIELYGYGHSEAVKGALALSEAYANNNQIDKAIHTLAPAVSAGKESLSSGHHKLLRAVSWLAHLKWRNGNPSAAAEGYREALQLWERFYGRNHKQTRINVANLGVCLMQSERIEEAIPFLEEVYVKQPVDPALTWVGTSLLEAYVVSKRIDKAKNLLDRVIADQRNSHPAGSPQLAGQLSACALPLLSEGWVEEAEPLIREALQIRKEHAPDIWVTFNTQAMLGGVLLKKGEYEQAEELLLAGYKGMKAREQTIPPVGRPRLGEAIQRLVKLYELIDRPDEAETWQMRLSEFRETRPTRGPSDSEDR